MNVNLFENYNKNNIVDSKIIDEYQGLVPEELVAVWREYGFGSLLDGYLKIINPSDYKEIIDMSYFRANQSIPIFVTAFGDIITWEENKYIRMIKYKNGIFKGIASGFDFFWEDLNTEEFCDEFFELSAYKAAVDRYGTIFFDECYGYVPLLGLGGSEKVENLQKVKIKEHIELITQLVGKIE